VQFRDHFGVSVAISSVIPKVRVGDSGLFVLVRATPRQVASVFPTPQHAQVNLQTTSVATRVDTEASSEILETTRVAPTDAANPPAIKTSEGHTDARKESPFLGFG